MAEILKGAAAAAALNARTEQKVRRLQAAGVSPTLGILRVGAREDDLSYERGAVKRCEKLGIGVRHFILPADTDQATLLRTLREAGGDPGIHGILMLRPLPEPLDEAEACRALPPEKDVDGITDGSLAGVFAGQAKGFPPCTAQACMEILDYYGIDCTGKRAVVVGRSLVVGRPAAMMLLAKNATVTLCHTRTKDLPSVCREAQILIAAAGRTGVVDASCLSPGQIVLDVGIHVGPDGKLCGDVAEQDAMAVAGAVTPVPGGVGAVTTSVLADHVAEAAARQTSGLRKG